MSQHQTKHERRLKRLEQRKLQREENRKAIGSAKKKNSLGNYIIAILLVAAVALFIYNSSVNASPYIPKADNDPYLGPIDAPIQIIAFGDFACPYTKQWVDNTFDALMQKYEGQVRFVYRDFPKHEKHPQGQKAAEAAECAGEQGKYWEYFRKEFDMQPALNVFNLQSYAQELGLDTEMFNECLSSGKYAKEVSGDYSDGGKAGVLLTPTFFVNGNLLGGAQDLQAFDLVIGQLLA